MGFLSPSFGLVAWLCHSAHQSPISLTMWLLLWISFAWVEAGVTMRWTLLRYEVGAQPRHAPYTWKLLCVWLGNKDE